jgi:hypothetical protein
MPEWDWRIHRLSNDKEPLISISSWHYGPPNLSPPAC